MSLAVAALAAKPADAGHPWGHSRAETMATTALSFILFFAGAQLALSGARELISPEPEALPGMPALIVTGASILGKLTLALILRSHGRAAGSSLLSANAANMAGDVLISAGVLAGLGVSLVFKAPAADPLAAILVGAWVIKSAVGIFRETSVELMDGTEGRGPYKLIFDAARSIPGVARPHRARMRRIADKWDIDMDIEVDGSLTVREAHALAHRVEEAIKADLPNVFDIMVHVEPDEAGRSKHSPEAFGLSESDVQKKE
jgi:cation diffusion facilitator family transporter